jgi:hypothetical protein
MRIIIYFDSIIHCSSSSSLFHLLKKDEIILDSFKLNLKLHSLLLNLSCDFYSQKTVAAKLSICPSPTFKVSFESSVFGH